jgi:hypothetical protein
MTIQRSLTVAAAILPLALAGAGFLMLDGLGSAEAAGGAPETVVAAAAEPVVTNAACQSATWPNIPSECLVDATENPRRVTVLRNY